MARVLAFVTILWGGCAQLAGIDETTDKGRGGNTVTVTRLSIGTELKAAPLDLNGLDATYFVANPESAAGFDRVLAAAQGPGKWSADLTAPAAVELNLPDVPKPIPRLFAFPNRDLQVLYGVLEHPDATAAPAGAMINLTVHNGAPLVATDAFQIYTVGSWTSRAIEPAHVPVIDGVVADLPAFDYAFESSSQLSGRGRFDRITSQDAYLVLRRNGAQLNGVGKADPFDQTGTDKVVVTIAPVALDQKLEVKLDPAKLATRYASVRPAVTGPPSMSWNLTASPAYLLANASGPSLHSGGILPTDTGVTAMYGNPFLGSQWRTLFTLGTSESRTYTPAGGTIPVTLSAGMNQFIEPSAGFVLDLRTH